MSFRFLLVLGGLLPSTGLLAQRLLWEQAFVQPATPTPTGGALALVPTGNQQFLLAGVHRVSLVANPCVAFYRAYYRQYTLAGTLISEHLGRGLYTGNTDYVMTGPNTGWVTATAGVCVGTQRGVRPFLQRLTPTGDTLPHARAWFLTLPTPSAYTNALLVQGNKLLTAGFVTLNAANGQYQQVQLICSDTLGRVHWTRNYPRTPRANDGAAALVPTPRGGYLLSGDAYNYINTSPGYNHYVLETDSAGNLLRSRIFYPLGPGFNQGSRYNTQCNVLALPNAGGYLLSGTADSVDRANIQHQTAYVMRLDTALNLRWVYRHPAALSGTGATQTHAYRLRSLPNGTAGLLLTEGNSAGTADVFLVQLDTASGRRLAFFTLSSNTQAVVLPNDWQWPGDGTLLLCGQSHPNIAPNTPYQSYVARWDFTRTPLAAATAREAAAMATFYAFPNPASGPLTLRWQLPLGQPAGQVRFYSVLGQLVKTQPLPLATSGQVEVSGLAPGLYLARLTDASGASHGHALRVEVRQ